jgi:teichuronic acid biosynthesis glycosyltransferase TuaG
MSNEERHTEPRVSVIIPAFNAESTIACAVSSCTRQAMDDLEVVIADNGSKDGTLEIAQELARSDTRIRVVSARARGAAHARNAAIEASTGRFLAFLDSDDEWLPEKLGLQLGVMQSAASPASCHAFEVFSDPPFRTHRVRRPAALADYALLLRTCSVGCSTVVLDTHMIGAVRFPTSPKEDYALWLSLARRGVMFLGINRVLSRYRVCPGSTSSRKVVEITRQWEVYRRQESIPIPKAFFYLGCYAYHGVRNWYLPAGTRESEDAR